MTAKSDILDSECSANNTQDNYINKVICGDSYEILKQLPDKSVDLVYIDIPYKINSGGPGKGDIDKRIKKVVLGDLQDIKDGIDYSIFKELKRIMKYIYIYMV